MRILSLFDGIAGAGQAMKELGYDFEYYSSEVDKYAIQVAKANHPTLKELGNVKAINGSDFKDITLLIGGFPCQSFSVAGNRKGLEDERGQLFFEMMRILEEVKPKYFLFENVASMSKANQGFISKKLGVKPIMINSALLTAQQRKRLYWTNIPNIKQPEDQNIYLKDIIEDDVDGKYFIRNTTFTPTKRNTNINTLVRVGHFNKGGQGDRVYSVEGKSACLSANGGGRGAKTGLYAIAQRGRNIVNGKRKDINGAKTEQRFETSYSEKSNCLTSVQKDSLLLDLNNYIIRKLTPTECERLQGFPDNYTQGISNTQRYKALGNSFTVPVIKHLLTNL